MPKKAVLWQFSRRFALSTDSSRYLASNYFQRSSSKIRKDLADAEIRGQAAPNKKSGGSRIRTGDPLLAKQVLYQLSYTPKIKKEPGW